MLSESHMVSDLGIKDSAKARISSLVVVLTLVSESFLSAGIMRVGTAIELNNSVGL